MAPRSLKKTFVGCKTCKRFGEDLYLKEAERVSNCKCSRVKFFYEKGGQGPRVRKKPD